MAYINEVHTKRQKIEEGFEQAQLPEAPTKEKPLPSISIGKKHQTLVQEPSAQKVISLSSAQIEIHDMNMEIGKSRNQKSKQRVSLIGKYKILEIQNVKN